jgi:hypothetical protein
MKIISAAILLSLAVGPALAQTAPAATTGNTEKKAISKSCSDQANAKGLHGKDRKKFRSDCKHGGGKSQ